MPKRKSRRLQEHPKSARHELKTYPILALLIIGTVALGILDYLLTVALCAAALAWVAGRWWWQQRHITAATARVKTNKRTR
jgi:hypothetical protein